MYNTTITVKHAFNELWLQQIKIVFSLFFATCMFYSSDMFIKS